MALTLKDTHEKQEEIPEPYRELYTQKTPNGKWELTGIQGVKTQADFDRQQAGLVKEREEHKATKEKLKLWDGLDHTEVSNKLSRIEELEAAAKGKLDDVKIDELANRRADQLLKSKLSPLERENRKLQEQLLALTAEADALKGEKRQRRIHDDVRVALKDAKTLPTAEDDALLLAERVFEVTEDGRVLTRDNVGYPPGLDAKAWLAEIQAKRPHWWPPSVGGGGKGSGPGIGFGGGANPWSGDGWNATEQGKFLRQHGREKADAMAKAAGTTVGGMRPKPIKK